MCLSQKKYIDPRLKLYHEHRNAVWGNYPLYGKIYLREGEKPGSWNFPLTPDEKLSLNGEFPFGEITTDCYRVYFHKPYIITPS